MDQTQFNGFSYTNPNATDCWTISTLGCAGVRYNEILFSLGFPVADDKCDFFLLKYLYILSSPGVEDGTLDFNILLGVLPYGILHTYIKWRENIGTEVDRCVRIWEIPGVGILSRTRYWDTIKWVGFSYHKLIHVLKRGVRRTKKICDARLNILYCYFSC